jgi:bifunctional non-homologous end joining protein LigD
MPTKKKNRQRPVRKYLRSRPTPKLPAFITPMAAQVVKKLPDGDDWIYELKFDGYRALIIKDKQQVEVRSRKNKDLTGMYPGIAAAVLRDARTPPCPASVSGCRTHPGRART